MGCKALNRPFRRTQIPNFITANIQGWRLRSMLLDLAKIVKKAADTDLAVQADDYTCTRGDVNGEEKVISCRSGGTVDVMSAEDAQDTQNALANTAVVIRTIAHGLPTSSDRATPDTPLDMIGWGQASVDANWGVVGTQLADLATGLSQIQVSKLWDIAPDFADAVFGESTTAAEKEEMQYGLDYAAGVLLRSLYDSTFSRIVWRLYGGAKGLVMWYYGQCGQQTRRSSRARLSAPPRGR
jgi:hypothetical protein